MPDGDQYNTAHDTVEQNILDYLKEKISVVFDEFDSKQAFLEAGYNEDYSEEIEKQRICSATNRSYQTVSQHYSMFYYLEENYDWLVNRRHYGTVEIEVIPFVHDQLDKEW